MGGTLLIAVPTYGYIQLQLFNIEQVNVHKIHLKWTLSIGCRKYLPRPETVDCQNRHMKSHRYSDVK